MKRLDALSENKPDNQKAQTRPQKQIILGLPDFRNVRTIPEHEEFTKFKIELIAEVYKKYCKVS